MIREDSSPFLLYIEPPVAERTGPINDELTEAMEWALGQAKVGTSNYDAPDKPMVFHPDWGYRGFHRTECGQMSDNHDYQLPNGMVTNKLAPFYVRFYRDSIPQRDRQMLMEVLKLYRESKTNA